ncbi:MAG: nucleotidyl transferase AbiEii/AbiGii toxin family protein [Candidatus Wildermuthbacteria bacterium]|nr:nucleotidyl transferase AbiEii/AbiGii toxin family protein [Candidatus Wildermuthbacteria bacterium]
MGQTILTSNQKSVLALVAQEQNLVHFYLSGGTALAEYYLHHRISDDLDFFILEKPDQLFLHKFAQEIKEKLGAQNLRYERLYERNQFFFQFPNAELKVEFTQYPFPQLDRPTKKDGVLIDSMRDIAANKLAAILDRFDPKDFVDLYLLLQTTSLETVRKDTEAKFGMKIDDVFLGGELAKVRRIEALPKMIKPLAIEELKTFFANKAKELSPNILL